MPLLIFFLLYSRPQGKYPGSATDWRYLLQSYVINQGDCMKEKSLAVVVIALHGWFIVLSSNKKLAFMKP